MSNGRESVTQQTRRVYQPRRKVCRFCAEGIKIDYKDAKALRPFLTDRGKIIPRRTTGTCAKHQRELSTAIKRARILAILPFTTFSMENMD